MFDIYVTYSPDQIRDTIGWTDKVRTNDLVQAIMVLCNYVEMLEERISILEGSHPAKLRSTDGEEINDGS